MRLRARYMRSVGYVAMGCVDGGEDEDDQEE